MHSNTSGAKMKVKFPYKYTHALHTWNR